jgi:hypothetical protein
MNQNLFSYELVERMERKRQNRIQPEPEQFQSQFRVDADFFILTTSILNHRFHLFFKKAHPKLFIHSSFESHLTAAIQESRLKVKTENFNSSASPASFLRCGRGLSTGVAVPKTRFAAALRTWFTWNNFLRWDMRLFPSLSTIIRGPFMRSLISLCAH